MQINIIAVGNKMPQWVNIGYQDYAKRMPPECRLNLIEISPEKRTKAMDVKRLLHQEGGRMLSAIPKQNYIIALDIRGKLWDTHQLASQLKKWQENNHDISLLIGGPEGIAPESLQKTHQQWSLSPLTFPHPLVRIIVAEQLYRAWSILTHHPYHRN